MARLALKKEFWVACVVYFVFVKLGKWFIGRATVYKLRLQIDSQAFSSAQQQTVRALNECTNDKIAACPIITHVDSHVREKHKKIPVMARDRYVAVCHLVTAAWANNCVTVVHDTPGTPDDLPDLEPTNGHLGDSDGPKPIIPTRNNTAPLNLLRRSVRIVRKTWHQLFTDIQLGQARKLPGEDKIVEEYSGVVCGPELFDITAAFRGDEPDEVAGVSRHLRQLKSLVTNDVIPRDILEDAAQRLNTATDIICGIVSDLATEHYLVAY